MTTFADIVSALSNQSFTFDELKTINKLANLAHQRNQFDAASVARAILKNGQAVCFDSKKLGKNVTGVILKIKPKNILIDCGIHGRWNVAASLVQPVKE